MNNRVKTISLSESESLSQNTLTFFAGPCAVESEEICREIASFLKSLSDKHKIKIVFKASFDKANRSSIDSFRSLGIDNALSILKKIKEDFQFLTMTDVHESHQVEKVSKYVDILQIPAFLCRQSDLILAAAKTGLPVNIKKAQFMSAEDMNHVLKKAYSTDNKNIFLTERGTMFGYQNLVVDFRNITIMKEFAPVVYDITHSVQRPGKGNGVSLGDRHLAFDLAKAAVAIGVSGFFLELHPNPKNAKSDAATMLNFKQAEEVILNLFKHHQLINEFDL